MRAPFHETRGGQLPERFAHRRARDVEGFGEFLLVQFLAGPQHSGNDLIGDLPPHAVRADDGRVIVLGLPAGAAIRLGYDSTPLRTSCFPASRRNVEVNDSSLFTRDSTTLLYT